MLQASKDSYRSSSRNCKPSTRLQAQKDVLQAQQSEINRKNELSVQLLVQKDTLIEREEAALRKDIAAGCTAAALAERNACSRDPPPGEKHLQVS
jgi:hypothetical protein